MTKKLELFTSLFASLISEALNVDWKDADQETLARIANELYKSSLKDLEDLAKEISKNTGTIANIDTYKTLQDKLTQFNKNDESTDFKDETQAISNILKDLIDKLENDKETISFENAIFDILQLSILKLRFNLKNNSKHKTMLERLIDVISYSYEKDSKAITFENSSFQKFQKEMIQDYQECTANLKEIMKVYLLPKEEIEKALSNTKEEAVKSSLKEILDKTLNEALETNRKNIKELQEEMKKKIDGISMIPIELQKKLKAKRLSNQENYTTLVTEKTSPGKEL